MRATGLRLSVVTMSVVCLTGLGVARDNDGNNSHACDGLPSQSALQKALKSARAASNGGFNLDMWGTIVNRDGVVCAVAFTGNTRGDQWPGSRAISAQKANTANAFSLPVLSLSTANLYSAVQPGGSLYGLQASNPVDTGVAYGGNPANYGQPERPDGGRANRRCECVRRGAGAVQFRSSTDRRPGRERRFLVRRPQHRLAHAQ